MKLKHTKEQVDYRASNSDERCETCIHCMLLNPWDQIKGPAVCAKIEGYVEMHYVCSKWEGEIVGEEKVFVYSGLKATEVWESTCVGILSRSFPMRGGNCFSVKASDGKEYKVVNMSCEDFTHLFGNEGFSIEIEAIGPRHAKVIDERIPSEKWFLERWCSTCTPKYLLKKHSEEAGEQDGRS